MEGVYTIILVVAGFVLRLGVPIAVTVLLAWFFRRLDARWEAEAEAQRARSEAMIAAGVPCWQINNCTEANFKDCPAYAEPDTACWEHFRDRTGNVREDCIGCGIFRRRAPASVTA
jgi:hypothetical protein